MFVYSDSFHVGWALCELISSQRQFFADCDDGQNPYGNDLQLVVNSQAACSNRKTALAELHDSYGDRDWNIDLVLFFDMLWRLAEQARALILTHSFRRDSNCPVVDATWAASGINQYSYSCLLVESGIKTEAKHRTGCQLRHKRDRRH